MTTSNLILFPNSSKLPTSSPLSLACLMLLRIHSTSSGHSNSLDQRSKPAYTEAEMWKKIETVPGKNFKSYHDFPILQLTEKDFAQLPNVVSEWEQAEESSSIFSKIFRLLNPFYLFKRKKIIQNETKIVRINHFFELLQIMSGDIELKGNGGLMSSGDLNNINTLFFIKSRLLPMIYFSYIYYPSKNYYAFILPTIQRSISNILDQISVPHRTRKNVKDSYTKYWNNEVMVNKLGHNKEKFVSRMDMYCILSYTNQLVSDTRIIRDPRVKSLIYGCLSIVYYIELPENELRKILFQFPKLITFIKQSTEQYLSQRITATPGEEEKIDEISIPTCIQEEWLQREVEKYSRMNKIFIGSTLLSVLAVWAGMNYIFKD